VEYCLFGIWVFLAGLSRAAEIVRRRG
jgi:hypothetical protein